MQADENFSTGLQMINKGHSDLITLLSNLRAAIKAQVCRYTIENTLVFLEEFVEVHFCIEERLMEHHGYPGYRSHKKKHCQFAAELEFLKEELLNIKTLGFKGSYELSVETIHLIVNWIRGHIAKDDGELGEFLQECSDSTDYLISSLCGPEDRVHRSSVTICHICKRIQGNKGIWRKKEHFHMLPAEGRYSRGLCPECLQKYYADLFQEKR